MQPGTGPFRVTRVHIPTAKMKGIVRDYLSMPSTILSPFFAEALLETHPEDAVPGEYAIAYIQINLRQYFPTTTLRPFFVNLPLAYNRRLPDYPVATVLMSQKKLLEAQLRTECPRIQCAAEDRQDRADYRREGPPVEGRRGGQHVFGYGLVGDIFGLQHRQRDNA